MEQKSIEEPCWESNEQSDAIESMKMRDEQQDSSIQNQGQPLALDSLSLDQNPKLSRDLMEPLSKNQLKSYSQFINSQPRDRVIEISSEFQQQEPQQIDALPSDSASLRKKDPIGRMNAFRKQQKSLVAPDKGYWNHKSVNQSYKTSYLTDPQKILFDLECRRKLKDILLEIIDKTAFKYNVNRYELLSEFINWSK